MDRLTPSEHELIMENASAQRFEAGGVLQANGDECRGLTLVLSGRLRAFYISEGGKELTLYRLLPGDCCIMTMSCTMRNITFGINLMAEETSEIITIPTWVYDKLRSQNIYVNQFTLEQTEQRLSDVFWLMEQFIFRGMGQRVAGYLEEQTALAGSDTVNMTHEAMARDLGTAREVVTRMLKHLENDGIVSQARGRLTVLDRKRLKKMAA